MPGVSFQFSAKDNSTKVFKSFNKSINDLNKNLKNMQKTLKSLSNIFSMTFGVIGKVVSSVVNLAVNIIKKGLSTIKNLITGAFNFIKSALTTLLSWMKKALGTVFDWIGKTVTTISKTAVNTAKKAISGIVKSIQSYADKEYNSIQLKVSLGSDYSKVQKSFDELVRMTTADRNDLWTVFATYAEVGKTADEISKYAKATVYLANATGLSLDRITRIFLAQEAATKNVEKALYKYGINIKNAKADLSDIEKIIVTMDEEMQALASDSLSQSFANVRNDLTAIMEKVGALFSGPVKYVSDKLDKLLQKILGSNKIEGLAGKLDALFEKLKPVINKIFEFLEKFIADPEGFFIAIKEDIQTIFRNLRENLLKYIEVIGFVLGSLFSKLFDVLTSIDFTGFKEAASALGEALGKFILSFGQGAGWWSEEDIKAAEGSLTGTFINAWNKAHPDFKLSKEDTWFKNLCQLLDWAKEEVLKPLWTDYIKPILDDIIDWVNTTLVPVLKAIFVWLGQVLAVALNNALASSEVVRNVLNVIPGVNMASGSEAAAIRQSLYEKTKQYLPAGWTADDLTKENLMNTPAGRNGNTNLMHWLFQQAPEEISWLRKYTILEEKQMPTFKDLADAIDAALNPAKDLAGAIDGAVEPLTEAAAELKSHVVTLHVQGTSTGYGKGGIQDYYGQNEFKVYPYAKGGLVTKPTVALIGEAGPELVIPWKGMPKLANADAESYGIGSNVEMTMVDSDHWLVTLLKAIGANTDGLDELLDTITPLITGKDSALAKWWKDTSLDVAKEEQKWEIELVVPWYKKLWNGVKAVGSAIGKAFGKAGTFLAQNGAFGSHIGNITSGIMQQQENGTLTIWTALGEVIKEFLPYLQKGLELVGGIFDKAFDILGNAVMKLGEEISTTLLPLLESFIPFMKVLADIVTALAPVVSSVLAPAIYVICAVLQVLTGLLDWLMPAFAGIGAVIQWVSDAITWAIGSFINWLASWIPWIDGVGEVHRPDSIKGYYNSIMGAYNDAKNTGVNASMAAAQTASQTVSYSGATHIQINNDFAGSYIVGSDGMSELALIMANQLDNLGYLKINLA